MWPPIILFSHAPHSSHFQIRTGRPAHPVGGQIAGRRSRGRWRRRVSFIEWGARFPTPLSPLAKHTSFTTSTHSPSTAAPTSDVGLPAPTVGGGGAGGVDAAAASLAPLPLPLNPLPDLPPAGDGRPVRAKRARRDAGAGLPQVDGSADDRASAGAGPAPQSPSGGAGPSGGVTAEPAAAEAAAGGGEGGPDDFADIPTSSDDEDGGGRGRGAARRSGSGGGGEDDGGGCAALRGDLLLATFDKVVRTRNRWRCVLRKAVLRLGGAEHFFDSIAGDMTF